MTEKSLITSGKEGVYFEMPDEEYHALQCVSSSGIKDFLVSPIMFWANSWMNPFKDDEDEQDERKSHAKTLGTAYHTRLLEGVHKFEENYSEKFQCNDEGMFKGVNALKSAIKERGGKGYSQMNTPELAEFLLRLDASLADKIYYLKEKAHLDANKGKIFLSRKEIRRIELAAQMIDNNPYLNSWLRGGYPEVSVIWYDEEFQQYCKARFDYLKVNCINDLKSFANQRGKEIDIASKEELAGRKYFLQSAFYLRGVEKAKELMRSGKIFGADDVNPKWLEAFCDTNEHKFNFLFQMTGIAPVAHGINYMSSSMAHETAQMIIRDALEDFNKCAETYGSTPWLDYREPSQMTDEDYPAWAWQL